MRGAESENDTVFGRMINITHNNLDNKQGDGILLSEI